jgi:hypothetical protein
MSVITETKEANQLGSMVEMELMTAGDLELESEGGMPGNEAESCDSNAMQRSFSNPPLDCRSCHPDLSIADGIAFLFNLGKALLSRASISLSNSSRGLYLRYR